MLVLLLYCFTSRTFFAENAVMYIYLYCCEAELRSLYYILPVVGLRFQFFFPKSHFSYES